MNGGRRSKVRISVNGKTIVAKSFDGNNKDEVAEAQVSIDKMTEEFGKVVETEDKFIYCSETESGLRLKITKKKTIKDEAFDYITQPTDVWEEVSRMRLWQKNPVKFFQDCPHTCSYVIGHENGKYDSPVVKFFASIKCYTIPEPTKEICQHCKRVKPEIDEIGDTDEG